MITELEFINRVLSATSNANSAKSFVRGIAKALGELIFIEYCQIQSDTAGWAVVPATTPGFWQDVEPQPHRQLPQLCDNLAIQTPSNIPEVLRHPQVMLALGLIIDSALQRLGAMSRVAAISRQNIDAKRDLSDELKRSEMAADDHVRSTSMRNVHRRIAMVAGFTTTVLIEGESGTGKERAATLVHRLSNRSHRPMHRINCAALTDTLLESELFGHERGAFTGAEGRHAGIFERSHRSTLLLDEVAELSANAQAKLLRVLQDGKVRRLGADTETSVDVRVIAASHRSLRQLVAQGLFREDLLYRLDVFSIRLPPLRERLDDLTPLVHSIVAQLAEKMQIAPPRLRRAVMSQLAAYRWPGNIRELWNVLEAAMIVNRGDDLTLGPEFTIAAASTAVGHHASTLDHGVQQIIEQTLTKTNGRIYGKHGAAIRLGLPAGTLQSKMKKLGIDRNRFVKG